MRHAVWESFFESGARPKYSVWASQDKDVNLDGNHHV